MQRALAVVLFLLICALGAVAQNATNCSSVPSPCGWNAQCNETESGPVCFCEAGYQLNSTNDCEMCPWGTWGWNCSYFCNCTDFDNSTTCHHVNGSCPEDSDDTITCYDNPCGENAECRHVNDTFECYCPAGYQPVNGTYDCEECSWNTWGVDCAGTCNCTDNSTTCNYVTGLCPEDELNCDSSPCGANANCTNISLGVYQCYCTTGYILVDNYWCMKCPAGTWGPNCTNNCSCGSGGNNCDHIGGECICNECYRGESCTDPKGSDCVRDFLEVINKCEADLKEMFGGDEFPQPPVDTLTAFAVDLMELDNSVVIQEEPNFDGFSREDVDQGPLVKLTWTVNKNADRPNAEAGLDRLAEQVKLGNIRSTLIINSREDSAEVTINSGIRRCEEDDSDNN